jgi:hypothetical protein
MRMSIFHDFWNLDVLPAPTDVFAPDRPAQGLKALIFVSIFQGNKSPCSLRPFSGEWNFLPTHPSHKDKSVARVGHPGILNFHDAQTKDEPVFSPRGDEEQAQNGG